jgi:cystathionine beta-lyase/cystathionine gamma-synthase
MDPTLKLETICAGAGTAGGEEKTNAPLVDPICASAVFRVGGLDQLDAIYAGAERGFIYTRDANPNHGALERAVSAIEGAEAGLACATGMAAIAVTLLTLLQSGDHVVASAALYGVTLRLIAEEWPRLGVSADLVDPADAGAFERALRPETRLVFVETISNPTLTLADLPALGRLCRARGVALVVDNTFAPCLVRPLEHGADVVVHSVTKYLGGHSDVTLGALAGRSDLVGRARTIASRWGAAANPFEAWLALRGIRTLPLRMERACRNAARIAAFLDAHPAVERVLYPALPHHPQAALARDLLPDGAGAMLSFEPRDQPSAGSSPVAASFIERLRLIPLSPSLADTTTTLSYPAGTSHRGLSTEELAAAGITDRLFRLSVGIDHVDDVIADLARALET